MKAAVCTIVAGPNGAGKTTFAAKYLPDRKNFINADDIAKDLKESPGKDVRAAKIFLEKVKEHKKLRRDFAIETTMSGTGHLKLVSDLLVKKWTVDLYYLWIPNIETSKSRVSDRVALGGHDIPEKDIIRRYPRSIYNLLCHYMDMCSTVVCIDNSGDEPTLIFAKDANGYSITQPSIYELLEKVAEDEAFNNRRL